MKPKKPKSHKKTKKKQPKEVKKTLDALSGSGTNSKKNNRGRKRKLPWSTVTGRASNYQFQLGQVWHSLRTPLLAAKTEEEVTKALSIPQIKFLARSLAGRPSLSFRSSRDICEKEALREKRKSPHRILRREYFIECSCGYNGPALDNDCPECGAQPQLSLVDWTGRAPEIPEVKTKRIRKKATPERHQEPEVTANPGTVQCECGATISAPSREIALEALAKHKQEEHPEIANRRTEERPE